MSDASLHELLSAWMDGQLTGSEKVRAERLISENPECADLVRQWKSQREQIRTLPGYRLDSDFSERVLAKANLYDDDGRVSRGLPAAVAQSAAQESTSYFASRSALTAITALAAMLLLTLFTLPNRGLPDPITLKIPPGVADKARHRSNNTPAREIASAKDEKTDDARFDSMKAGEADLELANSITDRELNEAVAAEPLAESDEGIQFKPSSGGRARGGIGGGMKREAMKSPGVDGFAKESQSADNSKAIDTDSIDSARKQVAGLEPATRQVTDFPILQDENRVQEKSDLGSQIAKAVPPAEPAPGKSANETMRRGANLQSLSLMEEQEKIAKDRVARQMSAALQSATNSVDEVWMIEIAEVPSLKQLDQAMRQNEIAFNRSPAQLGRQTTGAVLGDLDENVQAIYVITSPTQLRGAIRMLSRNATINAFPLPTSPANDQSSEIAKGQREQQSNESGDPAQAQLGQEFTEDKSLKSFPNSFAQQLPSNLRMKANLDPVEKLQMLNFEQTGAGADDGISIERSEDAANRIAGQAIPDAVPTMPTPDIQDQMVPGKSQIPSKAFQAGAGRLADGQLAAKQKSELQRHYLLLIRFDPATASEAEVAPADEGK